MCYLWVIRINFSRRTKCNQSAQTLNNFFHIPKTLAEHEKLTVALKSPCDPRTVLYLFSWMSSYHTIRFAASFDSYNLPMETSASSSLRPASCAIEKKTVLLTCTEMQPWLGTSRSYGAGLSVNGLWAKITFPMMWISSHNMARKRTACNLHSLWPRQHDC